MDGLDQLWLNMRRAEGWINNTSQSMDGLHQLWLNMKRGEESNNTTNQTFEVSRKFILRAPMVFPTGHGFESSIGFFKLVGIIEREIFNAIF